MSSILHCIARTLCCSSKMTVIAPEAIKVVPETDGKAPFSMTYSDPANIPRVIPPEGFNHYYPYGTIFPGEEGKLDINIEEANAGKSDGEEENDDVKSEDVAIQLNGMILIDEELHHKEKEHGLKHKEIQ